MPDTLPHATLVELARRFLVAHLVADATGETIDECEDMYALAELAVAALPADVLDQARNDAASTVTYLANL